MDSKAPHALCEECPLRDRPFVGGYGPPPGQAKYVVVGEAPGRTEAKWKYPFIGQSGQLLRSMMHHVGLDGGYAKVPGMNAPLEGEFETSPGDVYYTNCALCQPPGNKIPNRAAECCAARLAYEIKPYWDSHTPIAALGVIAGQVVIGTTGKSLRGKWFKDGRILCSWHPAYVLRVTTTRGVFSELLMDLRRLKRGKPMEIPYPTWEVPHTPEELDEVVDRVIALQPRTICFDLETDQLMWWKHKILCAAFAWDYEHAFVIPQELIYEETTSRSINRLFSAPMDFVGHNVKFDLRYMIAQMGVCVVPAGLQDTLIAHHVLDENMSHALKPLLHNMYDIGDYEGELIQRYLRTKGDFYSKVPAKYLQEYNVLDVVYTLRLWDDLKAELQAESLYDQPYQLPMMRSQFVFVDMEMAGMPVNRSQLQWLSEALADGIVQVQSQLEQACGYAFNANSYKQVGAIMYDHYALPVVRGRGFKPRSTCLQARRLLEQKVRKDHPGMLWLASFGQLKSLLKLRSSYVENVWKYLDEEDKVHPDCLVYGTESGRISVRDPPIQTIPRPGTGSALGDVWGQHIRGYYHAPEGYKMVEVDISQAEMRVACALSGEPFLHRIYADDEDLHTMVALEMYGPDFTKDQRNACKKFNFAYLYGGTEHSFALEEGMDMALAKQFVREYKTVMPVLTEWKDSMMVLLREQGYVETRTGRRRRFPILTNDNYDDARKAAVNTPVQGMASDVTLLTAIEVWEWLHRKNYWGDKATLVALIHDSLLMIVRDDYVKEVAAATMFIMESVGVKWVPEVPWKIDADVGQDWGHLKDISKWPEFADD